MINCIKNNKYTKSTQLYSWIALFLLVQSYPVLSLLHAPTTQAKLVFFEQLFYQNSHDGISQKSLNTADKYEACVLDVALAYKKSSEFIQFLLQQGADLNRGNYKQNRFRFIIITYKPDLLSFCFKMPIDLSPKFITSIWLDLADKIKLLLKQQCTPDISVELEEYQNCAYQFLERIQHADEKNFPCGQKPLKEVKQEIFNKLGSEAYAHNIAALLLASLAYGADVNVLPIATSSKIEPDCKYICKKWVKKQNKIDTLIKQDMHPPQTYLDILPRDLKHLLISHMKYNLGMLPESWEKTKKIYI